MGNVFIFVGIFFSFSYEAFAQPSTQLEIRAPIVRAGTQSVDEIIGVSNADQSLAEDLKISLFQIHDQAVVLGKVRRDLLSAVAKILFEDQKLAKRILAAPNLAEVDVSSWSDRWSKRPEKLLAVRQAVATLSERISKMVHQFDDVDSIGNCFRAEGPRFEASLRIWNQPCLRIPYYAEIFNDLIAPVNYGAEDGALMSAADLLIRSSDNLSFQDWNKLFQNYQRAREEKWLLKPVEREEWHRLLSNRLVEEVWRSDSGWRNDFRALFLQWRSGRLTLILIRNDRDTGDWVDVGWRYRLDLDHPPARETFYQLSLQLSPYIVSTLTPTFACEWALAPADLLLSKPVKAVR